MKKHGDWHVRKKRKKLKQLLNNYVRIWATEQESLQPLSED